MGTWMSPDHLDDGGRLHLVQVLTMYDARPDGAGDQVGRCLKVRVTWDDSVGGSADKHRITTLAQLVQ